MAQFSFSCIDAHTCGNPVRVVTSGAPILCGKDMSEKRLDFVHNHDWIRRSLMFEPRGHDMMSGTILYPPVSSDADIAVLFIETSGCLPMCGHGTIGTVTAIIEQGLVKQPRAPGQLTIDVPAGKITVNYLMNGSHVESVRLYNVPSYLAHTAVSVDCPGLGQLRLDVAYGGNYYAIVDPQENFPGLEAFSAKDVLRYSPGVRQEINRLVDCVHPQDPSVAGVSHVMWTGKPGSPDSTSRNAVFYGDNAIDRSPCGTGTSARMAQLHARGELAPGDVFIHESIIGSQFRGCIEAVTKVGAYDAIRPSIEGWAQVTGFNQILVDDRDPYAHGFQVQ